MSNFSENIKLVPNNPGVYIFYDKSDTILYVGKAKNLKKRVASYFNKSSVSYKTQVMVKQISRIKHIITNTESEALLLENNLIKKNQPKYNILLKDDKTFPWICIKNERFPRIYLTRQLVKDKSEYIGPFTPVYIVRTLLKLVKEIYPIRTCNFNLSEENITQGKHKVCLEYHLGNCKGPCEGRQKEEDYLKSIAQIRNVVKGNIGEVIKLLKSEMKKLASLYKFEEAEIVKQKLERLENYQSKSVVVNPRIDNVDVFTFTQSENNYYINYLKVIKGAIVQAHNMYINTRIEEDEQDVLLHAILDIRDRFNSAAKEILVPVHIEQEFPGITFILPQRGDKLKLMQLSKQNAKYFMLEQLKRAQDYKKRKEENSVLTFLQKDLRLQKVPKHIECFDNSNIQGTNPVAACVVFKNGKPAKSEYRHFNIKSVQGIDDFGSMKEIVFRRYKRLLEEKKDLPDLIVVDGGKGQLNAALASLKELQIYKRIPIIGIAKRLEEIYYPEDKIPLYIDKNSSSLKLLQHLRNEAHRFGISFHRDKRSKNFITSELENITGIGEKTVQLLLETYGSVENIKKISFEELAEKLGLAKAKRIKEYFRP